MWAYFALSAFAQSTVTSATVTDANGQAFASGTYRIQFNANSRNQPFVWNGAPFVPAVYAGVLDSTGSFSGISVPSSSAISPSGTNWTFTVCPASTSPCYSTNISLQGASESVTSQITPPAITVNGSASNQPTAYRDSEISGAVVGFQYFNLTDQTNHTCTVSIPCTWVAAGGGGGIGTVTVVTCAPGCSVANGTTTPVITCLGNVVLVMAALAILAQLYQAHHFLL